MEYVYTQKLFELIEAAAEDLGIEQPSEMAKLLIGTRISKVIQDALSPLPNEPGFDRNDVIPLTEPTPHTSVRRHEGGDLLEEEV